MFKPNVPRTGPRNPTRSCYLDNTPLTEEEWEFAKAMHRFRAQTNYRFPSWGEILGVLKSLGYRKPEEPG